MSADMPTQEEVRKDPRLNDEGLKREFARLWYVNPEHPYSCAQHLFGDTALDCNVYSVAVYRWMSDPEVLAEKERIRQEVGISAKLPTKDEIALAAWELTKEPNRTVADRLAGMRMAADLLGYTNKQAPGVSIGLTNSVMVMPAEETEEEWTAATQRQQRELQASARDTTH